MTHKGEVYGIGKGKGRKEEREERVHTVDATKMTAHTVLSVE